MKLNDIRLRDPFIIKDNMGGYLLTGTRLRKKRSEKFKAGVYAYKSQDKKNWKGPFLILSNDGLKPSYKNFWAPEIHCINNRYYLLVTLKPENKKRGTYMFVSDKLYSGYQYIARVTPENLSSLDGTLHKENNEYWLTYCYEWIENYNGEIRAVKMKNDFSGIDIATDRLLFKASDNKYKRAIGRFKITDGPFYFEKDNCLYMLWSTYSYLFNYLLLIAKSDNGKVSGKWTQLAHFPAKDGGHGMIFKDYNDKNFIVFHSPNRRKIFSKTYEHPVIMPFSVDKL